MHYTLMLEPMGVLIMPPYIEETVRPGARSFLEECDRLFNNQYLNTRLEKAEAERIMGFQFSRHYHFYDWTDDDTRFDRYAEFLDSHIIHVDVARKSPVARKRVRAMGHTFLSVPVWDGHVDDALEIACEEIRQIMVRREQ